MTFKNNLVVGTYLCLYSVILHDLSQDSDRASAKTVMVICKQDQFRFSWSC